MQVRLLGPLEIDGDDGRPAALGGRQAQALLGLLAVEANRVVPVSRLIDELWTDDPPATARKTVQTYVSRLRRALGSGRLQSSGDAYRLVAADDEIDALEFARLVAASRFEEALALWRGPPLTGLEFVPALAAEAARLEQLRADAIERRVDAALAAGEHARLVPELEALVREQPLREALRARLMLALYRAGRQADALEVYRQGRARLADELGLEPSERLRDLERQILAHDPALEPGAGERADGSRPSGRSLSRTNLPVPLTPFLGRERELTEVISLARQDDVRIVTVTGAGGIGKTRLAIQAAAELAGDHPDGVFWSPLAALCDAELVLEAIGQALGTTDELASHIGDRRVLILVDNVEHLLEAAAALRSLLSACPRLKLLVTSRERLAIAGEHEYPLSTLSDADGRQLFTERARSLDPGFQETPIVAELCRRLDNLPLALELAAARTKLFTAEQLLERLPQRLDLLRGGRDLDARQQTLRATIEWSYDLLDAGERLLFARLAVFPGGCTLEAAEAVCDADPDRLGSLLDKSLLSRRNGDAAGSRLSMLETIREYALERLEESQDADELRHRHADFFFELATAAEGPLESRDQARWLDRLSAEVDNVRAVLEWSLEHDVAAGLRLAAALRRFWELRGHSHELVRWFDAAFQRADRVPEKIRLRALRTEGDLRCFQLGERERAREVYGEGLSLARRLGDEAAEAWFLNVLGASGNDGGGYDEDAIGLVEQALETFRHVGDGHGAAMALNNLGTILCDLGRFHQASERYEEAVANYESLGEPWGVSLALQGAGDVALLQHDMRRAGDLFGRSLEMAVELDDKRLCAYSLAGLASTAALAGDLDRAGTLWAGAELLEEAHRSRMLAEERARYERLLAAVRDAPAFATAYERGRELTPEEALDYALRAGELTTSR